MPTKKKTTSYKGLQKDIRRLKMPKIDTWRNEYPDKDYKIELEIIEFSCLCPKTGLPDFAFVYIEYIPDKECVELKSFKSYILSYRNLGIFHEHVINKIMDDFIKSARPRWALFRGEFNIRGGIKTTVIAEYKMR